MIVTEHGVVIRHILPPVTEDNGSVTKFSVITPSENISRPVFLVYGTGDLNVNSDFCANQVYERMKKNGKGQLCSVLRYPAAGHLIEPPYTPHCYSSLAPQGHLVWGGETEAQAQADAWPKIIAFLRKNICHKQSRL